MDLTHPFAWLPELALVVRSFSQMHGMRQRANLRRVCRAWRDLDLVFLWFKDHDDLRHLGSAKAAFDTLMQLLGLRDGRNLDLPIPSTIRPYDVVAVDLFFKTYPASSYRFANANSNSTMIKGPVTAAQMGQAKANQWNDRVMVATDRLTILANGRRVLRGFNVVI